MEHFFLNLTTLATTSANTLSTWNTSIDLLHRFSKTTSVSSAHDLFQNASSYLENRFTLSENTSTSHDLSFNTSHDGCSRFAQNASGDLLLLHDLTRNTSHDLLLLHDLRHNMTSPAWRLPNTPVWSSHLYLGLLCAAIFVGIPGNAITVAAYCLIKVS